MGKGLITAAMVLGAVSVVLGLLAKYTGPVLTVSPRAYVDISIVCFLAAIALELYPGKK